MANIMALRTKSAGISLPMRVWDGATRLFHWSLVVLLAVCYGSVTFATGSEAALLMQIHLISGEALLALLLFRIAWGLVGSDTARFSHFLRSPLRAVGYLKGLFRREPDTQVGHNPAGGWMVMIILGLLAAQIGTGLGSNDDGATEGPLMAFISKATSDRLSELHSLIFNLLVAAIIVHVVTIGLYAVVKRQNLTAAMITGKKKLPAATRAPRMASPLLALLAFIIAAGIATAVALQ
jgi:cytochrome b